MLDFFLHAVPYLVLGGILLLVVGLIVRNFRESRETRPPTFAEVIARIGSDPDPRAEADDAPLGVLVNLILYEAAVEMEATRIRIDGDDADHCMVGARVADAEHILVRPPARLRAALVDRIAFMAAMEPETVPGVGFIHIIFGELPQMMLNVEIFLGSDGKPSALVHILVHSIKAALASAEAGEENGVPG